MSQAQDENANHENAPAAEAPVEETPVEETPAVAGGHDDEAPAQGEGATDSY